MASNHYRDMQQFQNDFELMFRNAMKYNEEGSPIYEDAVVLRDVFLKSVAELTSEENSQSVGTDPGPTKKR